MPRRRDTRARGRLHSRIQTRGGGKGGCSSAELKRLTTGDERAELGIGPVMSMPATVVAGIKEHFAAQAPDWSQPLCFSQGSIPEQQSV